MRNIPRTPLIVQIPTGFVTGSIQSITLMEKEQFSIITLLSSPNTFHRIDLEINMLEKLINWGAFIHFWSGAADINLKTSAFENI